MKERSKALKTRQGKDCMMLNHTLGVQLELPLFATVESLPQNSEMTLTDKSSICNPSTQKQKSSKTLDQDSTSKEKVCVPYWTDFCKEISSCLLLPVETGLQDLDLNLYNTWSNKTVDKSWFSTKLYTVCNQNLPKIYTQSFTSFPVESTDWRKYSKKIKEDLSEIESGTETED